MKKILTTFAVGTLLLASCYDDKGNYDFSTLDEVKIDTAGCNIHSQYTMKRYSKLHLEPNVIFNGAKNSADAPLDYLWTIYSQNLPGNDASFIDTLGTERVLDAPINPVTGGYIVQLTVTNRKDKVEQYFKINVQTEEAIPDGGWLVLYEPAGMPGYADLGLIVNKLVKPTASEDEDFWNLISTTNGEPQLGNPIRVIRTVIETGKDDVLVVTNKDIIGYNYLSFLKNPDRHFENFFMIEPPATRDIKWYGPSGMSMAAEVMINDDKVYQAGFINGPVRNSGFGLPKHGDDGELAPWMCDVTNQLETIYYNNEGGYFANTIRYGDGTIWGFAVQNESAAFDVNNMPGEKFLMADWGYGGGVPNGAWDHIIFDNNGSRHLAVANFALSNSGSTSIGLGWYDMNSCPDVKNITTMAAAKNGQFIYYGAGNKVYNYAYASGKTPTAVFTGSGDEVVTCVRTQKFYYLMYNLTNRVPNNGGVVHIATWSESAKQGKVYQYTINPANGEITSEPMVYTVPGKVKDMSWKYM